MADEPKYLNKFHKESTEESLRSIEEMKKLPMNYEEELERHKKLQVEAKKLENESHKPIQHGKEDKTAGK